MFTFSLSLSLSSLLFSSLLLSVGFKMFVADIKHGADQTSVLAFLSHLSHTLALSSSSLPLPSFSLKVIYLHRPFFDRIISAMESRKFKVYHTSKLRDNMTHYLTRKLSLASSSLLPLLLRECAVSLRVKEEVSIWAHRTSQASQSPLFEVNAEHLTDPVLLPRVVTQLFNFILPPESYKRFLKRNISKVIALSQQQLGRASLPFKERVTDGENLLKEVFHLLSNSTVSSLVNLTLTHQSRTDSTVGKHSDMRTKHKHSHVKRRHQKRRRKERRRRERKSEEKRECGRDGRGKPRRLFGLHRV